VFSHTCVACPDGLWGPDCRFQCHCLLDKCDKSLGCSRCEDSGWTGPDCDRNVDECSGADVPCGNDSKCIDTPGSYRCECGPWRRFLDAYGQTCDCESLENVQMFHYIASIALLRLWGLQCVFNQIIIPSRHPLDSGQVLDFYSKKEH
jgi:hypothetical protein